MTVALVQGDAIGGGFEAMLTNDVVIAERHGEVRAARDPVQPVPRAWARTACCSGGSASAWRGC